MIIQVKNRVESSREMLSGCVIWSSSAIFRLKLLEMETFWAEREGEGSSIIQIRTKEERKNRERESSLDRWQKLKINNGLGY